jgi:hypothetical protein
VKTHARATRFASAPKDAAARTMSGRPLGTGAYPSEHGAGGSIRGADRARFISL